MSDDFSYLYASIKIKVCNEQCKVEQSTMIKLSHAASSVN